MGSADGNLEVVDRYLATECELGRMIRPLLAAELKPTSTVQVSHFGVIPKGHLEGKWRLLL